MTRLSRAIGRSGTVKAALLLWFIVLAAIAYYGIEVGGVYWRRYKLEEIVKQELSFAGQATDEAIHRQVLDEIEAMDLPIADGNVQFVRTDNPRALRVSISYVETANLLFTEKQYPMSVEVEREF
jgi:hypothetical protein